jgi:hypothetical protein
MNERHGEGAVAELDRLRRDGRKVSDKKLLQTLGGLKASA